MIRTLLTLFWRLLSVVLPRCIQTLVSEDLLDSIIEHHQSAEITFSKHLDPDITDRQNISFNEGKVLVVSPPFPRSYQRGCFHPKLLLLRFSDRLRIVISSANLTMEDWNLWSQCVWMQVWLARRVNCRTSSTHRRTQRVLRTKNSIWSFARSSSRFCGNAACLKSGFSTFSAESSSRTCLFSLLPRSLESNREIEWMITGS